MATTEELIFVLESLHIIATLVLLLTALYPIPYGRYQKTLKLSTGWTISGKNVWKGFNITWMLPVLLMIFTNSPYLTHWPNALALFLYIFHYAYRSLIYPTKFMQNASPWPIESVFFALLACSFNGTLQAFHLLHVNKIGHVGIVNYFGVILFFAGLLINITHDEILAELRQGKGGGGDKEKLGKYFIPRGGLFNYISAANYFGEIVEWWGWAIFAGGLPQMLFGVTTTIILGVRGYQHHKFYQKTFGKNYPSSRKAIVPFII